MKNGNLASENIEASTVKKVWWPRLPFAALLIIFTVSAYLPSLDKVFTFDQMSYFLELNGETSLASGFRLFDYEANRQYGKGDEVLYRPLLFTVLALENTLFHRDFRLWNIANLVFHLLVAYLLFEVLWRIKPSLLACGVALLFGLLASNFVWNTIMMLKPLSGEFTFTAVEYNEGRTADVGVTGAQLRRLGLAPPVVSAGRTDTDGDLLYRWDQAAGEYFNYWLSDGSAFPAGWLKGLLPAGMEVLLPGEGIVVRRQTDAGVTTWWTDGKAGE